MAGGRGKKGKGGRGGGIRKKRKGGQANKQRLVRVERLAEEREKRSARRVAALRERISKIQEGPSLEIPDEYSEVDYAPLREIPKEDNDDERAGDAYESLLNSIHTDEKMLLLEKRDGDAVVSGKSKKRPRTKEITAGDEESEAQVMANGKFVHDIDGGGTATAAEREQHHFGETIPKDSVPGELQPLCARSDFGRILVSRPSRGYAQGVIPLMDILASETPNLLSGPCAVGAQPGLVARYNESFPEASLADSEPIVRAFGAAVRDFQDVLVCRKLRPDIDDAMRRMYVAHTVSHVLRCKARLARHDAMIAAKEHVGDECRDQGFSRARVLILAPMRNAAYETVHTIIKLAVGNESGVQIANKERFEEEFAPESGETENENFEETTKGGPRRKPADHVHTFRGNVDDDFKLGISLSRKSVKIFSDFYASDVIVASPLGLRRNLAAKSTGSKSTPKKGPKEEGSDDDDWKTGLSADSSMKKDADDNDDGFLSSIDICVLDGAHIFTMQNWDTVLSTFSHMNNVPSNPRETDFSRVRGWALDGLMKRYRQTIVLSNYKSAEVLAVLRSFSNHAGRVHLLEVPTKYGTQNDVALSIRQTFIKVADVESPAVAPDKRFEHFTRSTLPLIRSLVDSQTLVIVPSYFDFVRVRNHLVKLQEDDPDFRFATMCEYSRAKDVVRSRARLVNKHVSIAVMTERFHFYWRHWIRGFNTVVWFALPHNAIFYPEIVNMTAEAAESGAHVQCIALYDQFDAFALERIVGYSRSKRMLSRTSKSTFMFLS